MTGNVGGWTRHEQSPGLQYCLITKLSYLGTHTLTEGFSPQNSYTFGLSLGLFSSHSSTKLKLLK